MPLGNHRGTLTSSDLLQSAMHLQTSILGIRPFTKADADSKFRIDSDPDIQRFLGSSVSRERFDRLYEDLLSSASYDFSPHAVVLIEEDTPVGYAGFHVPNAAGACEVYLALLPAYRRNNFGSTVLHLLLEHASSLTGVASLVGRVDPANPASIRLLEKNGFVRTGKSLNLFTGSEDVLFELRIVGAA